MMGPEKLIILFLIFVTIMLLYLAHKLRHTHKLLLETKKTLQEQLQKETNGLFEQLEAYSSLRDRLNLHKGLPYTPKWSASPDFLQLIVEHSLEAKPATVFECSSGLTTLMLARCCQMNERGDVFSLENGEEYAVKTRSHLDRYGLGQIANVIHAPLEQINIKKREFKWYSTVGIPDRSIDMLVIDGPPGFIQKHSRYPALPLLYDKLADGCVVFMDDAARQDEKEVVKLWQAEYPGIDHRYIETERGCSILTINKRD